MRTILIMDEDQAIRMLYIDVLSEEGYEVIACGDAGKVLELISCRKPDLVVMEAMLKNGHGLDLLQDIANTYHDLPVILCTTCPAFKEDLRSLAAQGFVVKGSNLKALKAVIENVFEGRTPARPAQVDLPEHMTQESFQWQ
jgi:two-component system, OmpR family, response regulator CpxR